MHLLCSLLISTQPVSFTTNCLFFNLRVFKTRKNKMVISYIGAYHLRLIIITIKKSQNGNIFFGKKNKCF